MGIIADLGGTWYLVWLERLFFGYDEIALLDEFLTCHWKPECKLQACGLLIVLFIAEVVEEAAETTSEDQAVEVVVEWTEVVLVEEVMDLEDKDQASEEALVMIQALEVVVVVVEWEEEAEEGDLEGELFQPMPLTE